MRRFVYQLVGRLADPQGGLSRNRHFELLATPAGKRARKLFRHLQSIEQDLERHPDCRVSVRPLAQEEDGAIEVRVEIPALKLVRTAQLTADDLAVLEAQDSRLFRAVAPALRRAPPV